MRYAKKALILIFNITINCIVILFFHYDDELDLYVLLLLLLLFLNWKSKTIILLLNDKIYYKYINFGQMKLIFNKSL